MKSREVWRSGGMMALLGALIGLREAGSRLGELAEQVASFVGGLLKMSTRERMRVLYKPAFLRYPPW